MSEEKNTVEEVLLEDELVDSYSEKKVLVKKLTEEMAEMEPKVSEIVAEALEKSGQKTINNSYGNFKISTKKKITYSEDYESFANEKTQEIEKIDEEIKPFKEKINSIQDEVKQKAKEEEKDGTAIIEIIGKSAVFTVAKTK